MIDSIIIFEVKEWQKKAGLTHKQACLTLGVSYTYYMDMRAQRRGEYFTDGKSLFIKKIKKVKKDVA